MRHEWPDDGDVTKLFQRLSFRGKDSTRLDTAGAGPIADVEFRIANMVCEGCAEKIEDLLHALSGVRAIRSDVANKQILVCHDPEKVSSEQLKTAVSRAGFTAVLLSAGAVARGTTT